MKNPTSRISSLLFVAIFILLFLAPVAHADDSAASIAAGGLVPHRETRIVMAKEVLRISPKKVVVDYDFRNDSDQAVTTEVAFPIPPYKNEFPSGNAIEYQNFSSFRLWVNGKPIHYRLEAKATLKGKDVTGILNADHIDISTFGHFTDLVTDESTVKTPDFSHLSNAEQKQFVKAGLFDTNDPPIILGLWTVHQQYHWRQTFPAHSTVHIRHEYEPIVGFEMMSLGTFQAAISAAPIKEPASSTYDLREDINLLHSFCMAKPVVRNIIQRIQNTANEDAYAYLGWVDFILTTANTWKRPIEDFTLIVDRTNPENGSQSVISFCSPGPVEKIDAKHFRVHLTNFVPTRELHIGFFGLPVDQPDPSPAKK